MRRNRKNPRLTETEKNSCTILSNIDLAKPKSGAQQLLLNSISAYRLQIRYPFWAFIYLLCVCSKLFSYNNNYNVNCFMGRAKYFLNSTKNISIDLTQVLSYMIMWSWGSKKISKH